jgi:hypothetical protein
MVFSGANLCTKLVAMVSHVRPTSLLTTSLVRGLGFFAEFLRNENGSALVYLTLVLPVLIGIAGLAAEGGSWLYTHRVVQSAADNAAYSAANAYAASHSADLTAQARAITANDYNLVDGVDGVTVTVNVPPTGNCYGGTSNYTGTNAIEVIVTQPKSPLLSKIWLANDVNICGRAVAVLPNSGDCILALAPTGIGIGTADKRANNTHVDLTGCGIFSNSSDAHSISMTGNNNVLSADYIGATGGINVAGNQRSTVLNSSTGNPPVADPYASDAASWPQSEAKPTPRTDCVQNVAANTCTFSPGTYVKGISIPNGGKCCDQITLNPGIYYVSGISIARNNATLNGSGVTIVLTGGTSGVTVTGNNDSINLTAPTSGWNAGITIWAPTSTGNIDFIGNSGHEPNVTITGVIYAPNANVLYTGNTVATAVCTQIVAKTVQFGGNSINLTGDCGLAGMKTFGQIAALVE